MLCKSLFWSEMVRNMISRGTAQCSKLYQLHKPLLCQTQYATFNTTATKAVLEGFYTQSLNQAAAQPQQKHKWQSKGFLLQWKIHSHTAVCQHRYKRSLPNIYNPRPAFVIVLLTRFPCCTGSTLLIVKAAGATAAELIDVK